MKATMMAKALLALVLVVLGVWIAGGPRMRRDVAHAAHAAIQLSGEQLNNSYCCCSATDVDAAALPLLKLLNKITVQPYFRYFKVNTERPCPYWAVTLLCTSAENMCQVCACDDKDVPQSLREQHDMTEVHEGGQAAVTKYDTLPHSNSKLASVFDRADDAQERQKHDKEHFEQVDKGAKYVDLSANPEANTGYTGPLANKVWQTIYNENCMQLENASHCKEVAVLRTLVSGLHFSINTHVVANNKRDPAMKSPLYKAGMYNHDGKSYLPDCEAYRKRIAPNAEFVGNLYVLYQFVLRAVAKAKPIMLSNMSVYNTGDDGSATEKDRKLHALLQQLYEEKLLCVKTFDETLWLESPRGRELAPEIERVLLNVTNIMDCVTCEKCRIWGKLATKGIVTAMRILRYKDTDTSNTTAPPQQQAPLTLTRSERVTLINLLRQLSFSVYAVQFLGEVCAKGDL